MKYEEIEKVNKKLKTTDLKGKNYIEVSERIKGFWMLYPNGRIITEIINTREFQKINEKKPELSETKLMIIIRANVYDNDSNLIATGIACEKEGTSYINQTAFVENCETSAVGRALGFLGIGSDTDIASANEIINQVYEEEANKKISAKLVTCLNKSIENNMIADETVKNVLANFGYKELKDICTKDYMTIVEELKKSKSVMEE